MEFNLQDNAILDLEKFKRNLREQKLLTTELEEFIERYMQFDNEC